LVKEKSENGDAMSDIKVYKLINGEEIITKVTGEDESSIQCENPASIVIQDAGGGKAGVGMAPYMPYIEKGGVSIMKNALASEGTADEKLAGEYNRIFGSGLVVPQKQKIIGA
jgi:hypothetical protein